MKKVKVETFVGIGFATANRENLMTIEVPKSYTEEQIQEEVDQILQIEIDSCLDAGVEWEYVEN